MKKLNFYDLFLLIFCIYLIENSFSQIFNKLKYYLILFPGLSSRRDARLDLDSRTGPSLWAQVA
jgi:hypothetical protein